ncbi:hypothetical protein QOT17_005341 [Balamuthia mandrillaris]
MNLCGCLVALLALLAVCSATPLYGVYNRVIGTGNFDNSLISIDPKTGETTPVTYIDHTWWTQGPVGTYEPTTKKFYWPFSDDNGNTVLYEVNVNTDTSTVSSIMSAQDSAVGLSGKLTSIHDVLDHKLFKAKRADNTKMFHYANITAHLFSLHNEQQKGPKLLAITTRQTGPRGIYAVYAVDTTSSANVTVDFVATLPISGSPSSSLLAAYSPDQAKLYFSVADEGVLHTLDLSGVSFHQYNLQKCENLSALFYAGDGELMGLTRDSYNGPVKAVRVKYDSSGSCSSDPKWPLISNLRTALTFDFDINSKELSILTQGGLSVADLHKGTLRHVSLGPSVNSDWVGVLKYRQ